MFNVLTNLASAISGTPLPCGSPSCFVLPVLDVRHPQVIGQERFWNEYNKISAKATQAGLTDIRN